MLKQNTINININDLTNNRNNSKSNTNNNNKVLNKKGSHNFSKQIYQFGASNLNGSPISLKNLDSTFSSSLSHFDVSTSNSINKMANLQTQGGGHAGILQGRKGKYSTIAKPLNSEREGQFYKRIKNTPLYQCVPKFFGMKKENLNNNNNNDIKQTKPKYWLLLQDLTANMTSPCIADLKIGTRTYEINVPLTKQERQKSLLKGTTTLSHAVRCIDIAVRKNNEVLQSWNRKVGRKMSWTDLQKALEIFLSSKQRVEQFKDQLKVLREKLVETYNVLPNMRLYSASILIVYDGDKENGQLFVKLIDFGHGYTDLASEGGNIHDPTCDDNALLGIDNLLLVADSFLQNIQ